MDSSTISKGTQGHYNTVDNRENNEQLNGVLNAKLSALQDNYYTMDERSHSSTNSNNSDFRAAAPYAFVPKNGAPSVRGKTIT